MGLCLVQLLAIHPWSVCRQHELPVRFYQAKQMHYLGRLTAVVASLEPEPGDWLCFVPTGPAVANLTLQRATESKRATSAAAAQQAQPLPPQQQQQQQGPAGATGHPLQPSHSEPVVRAAALAANRNQSGGGAATAGLSPWLWSRTSSSHRRCSSSLQPPRHSSSSHRSMGMAQFGRGWTRLIYAVIQCPCLQ